MFVTDLDWKADASGGIFNPYDELVVTITAPHSLKSSSTGFVTLSVKLFLCADGACRAVSSSITLSVLCVQDGPKEVVHSTEFHID